MCDVLWRPYQNMFGEIGDATIMETMTKSYCELKNETTKNLTTDYCENKYNCDKENDIICGVNIYIVRIFLAAYMMFAAVLMLNLMVAGKYL